jgi:hypothetical protein
MRTTIDIEDALLQRAKEEAARTNRTLRTVVEDSLRETFSRQESQKSAKRVALPVSDRRGGLCPGVDLDDSAGLLDVMEARSASA